MDNISKLYWQLHPDAKFNFYELCGFRAGYLGKKSEFNNFERLPDALVNDWLAGHAEGKEEKIGRK